MKKNSLLALLLMLLGNASFAQINFDKGTWGDVLNRAKSEDKIIFVDVYTDWCGPCKMMDKNIFSKEEVGNVYNNKFVCYKLNAEKGEGVDIAKKYNVKVFPTFLYIDGNGKLLYQFSGTRDIEGMIDEAAKVSMTAPFGGWDKMNEIYKAKTGTPNFYKVYYKLVSEEDKAQVMIEHLKSMSDKELLSVETAKLIEDGILYNYNLLKRMVEGRIKLGEQSDDFNFFVTFGLQSNLTKYFRDAIVKDDEKQFKELLELKRILSKLKNPRSEDPDIDMIWGRGELFSSENFLLLKYYCVNRSNDSEFPTLMEKYMDDFINKYPLKEYTKLNMNSAEQMKVFGSLMVSNIIDKYNDMAINIIDFTEYYWLLTTSSKEHKEKCIKWIEYACMINSFNPKPPTKAASLLVRLNKKKDAIKYLENIITVHKDNLTFEIDHKMMKDSYFTPIGLLKDKLRDVKNNKL